LKVLFTSALIDYKFDIRKYEYIKSYNKLTEYIDKKDIYIIECYKNEYHFLENVFYSNTNNDNLNNKGVKELMAIIKFLETHKIDDDELIVKMTGRYLLLDDTFLKNITGYDCYIRKDKYNQVFFGLFAIKFKIFKQFLDYVDLNFLETHMVNVEKALSMYLDKFNINYYEFNKLNLYSNINNEDIVIW